MRKMVFLAVIALAAVASAQENKTYDAYQINDFEMTGDGTNEVWNDVSWAGGTLWLSYSDSSTLPSNMQADFKAAYSADNLYIFTKRLFPDAKSIIGNPGGAFTFAEADSEFFITGSEANFYHGAFKAGANWETTGEADKSFDSAGYAPWPAPADNTKVEAKTKFTDDGWTCEIKIPRVGTFDPTICDLVNGTSFQFQICFSTNAAYSFTRWSGPGVDAGGFIKKPWGTLNLVNGVAAVNDWSLF
ncbi:hypothetical protein GX645_00945 [Candidatus Sumerlaeota bacterium]|nr:hypothetical protein [Candidatus Sumerlaeota bacterium]